jgi:hypothetical protein
MRITQALALIGAAAISFSASAAPAANNADSGISQVSVTSRAHSMPTEGDIAGLQGAYNLSDGRKLQVSTDGNRLYARLGDTRAEILSVGPNQFASRDDALQINFDNSDNPDKIVVRTFAGK